MEVARDTGALGAAIKKARTVPGLFYGTEMSLYGTPDENRTHN